MNQLLYLFMRMWVLRANPQDLPPSRILTFGMATLYMLISFASMFRQLGLPSALAASTIDIALLATTVYALLAIAHVPERGYQTLSAVFGASFILVLATLLLVALLGSAQLRNSMILLLLAWYLLMFGHILRQAIAMPVLLGAVIAFVYLMLSAGIIQALFLHGAGSKG